MGSSGATYQTIDEGGGLSGPVSSTDNALVRWDGTDGLTLQNGLVVESDAGTLSGITLLDVDNLRLDGNTLSAQNANGSIVLSPDGSGRVSIGGSSSSFPSLFPSSGALDIRKADGSGMAPVVADALFTVGSVGGAGQWKVLSNGDQVIRSGAAIKGSDSSDTNGSLDVDMRRGGAGVWLDGNGSGGLGFRLTGRPVEASTAGSGAPNILAATESGKLITNEGVTAEAYNTLPTSAPVGCECPFYCADADGIRVTAPTGETIRTGPGSISATGGFIRSTVIGSGIILTKINSTSWVSVTAPNGTWTVDV